MPALKRLSAILFLSILLFNVYGYQLLINFWQNREEAAFKTQLYTNSQDETLISIKLPATLPPYADNLEKLEWVDGEVNVEGVIYKYVKRRIFKDSVEFLCVPHTAKMRLENAREDFFRLCNDLQNASKQEKNHTSSIKPIVFEYCSEWEPYQISLADDHEEIFPSIYDECKPVAKEFAIDHPPEHGTV